MLSRFEILQRDVNLLFYQGIPDDIRKKVRKRLPSINQKTSNPPDVDMTLDLLRQEFDEADIDGAVKVFDLYDITDDDAVDSESNTTPRFKKTKKSTIRFGSNSPTTVPTQTSAVEPAKITDVDALHRELQELEDAKQRLLREDAATRMPTTSSLQSCSTHFSQVANIQFEGRNLLGRNVNTTPRILPIQPRHTWSNSLPSRTYSKE